MPAFSETHFRARVPTRRRGCEELCQNYRRSEVTSQIRGRPLIITGSLDIGLEHNAHGCRPATRCPQAPRLYGRGASQLSENPEEATTVVPLTIVPVSEFLSDWEEKGLTSVQPLNDRWPSVCSEIHTSRFGLNSNGREYDRD